MKNPKALWESCLQYIKQNVEPDVYEKLFSGIEIENYNEATRTLRLWVPSQFIYEYIEKNHMAPLRTAIFNTFGNIQLYWHPIVVKNDKPTTSSGKSHNPGTGPTIESFTERDEKPQGKPLLPVGNATNNVATGGHMRKPNMQQLPDIDPQLNTSQTFKNFVEGDSNKLCLSVGYSISEHPNTTQFNPMFIYGPSGCGKTHLVNAMGLHCKSRYPDMRVLYVPSRIFVLQFTNAVRENNVNDFIAFYQTIDMLIVDDIQEWNTPNLQTTVNNFFHIFNHLFRNKKRIILVSDRPPVELKQLSERMITRFSVGLVAEMEKPNVQLCRDILRRKIARDGLSVPNDVIDYIAENANGSIRELEGVINSLMAYSIVYNSSINMNLVERVVKRTVTINDDPVTIDNIFSVVCEYYNITEQDLKARTRRRDIAQPRQVVMYLADKHIHMPTSRIGRYLGGRDHSTILHGIAKVQERMKVSKDFRLEIEEIERKLLGEEQA